MKTKEHPLLRQSNLRYKIRRYKLNRFYSKWIEKFHGNKAMENFILTDKKILNKLDVKNFYEKDTFCFR